MITIKSTLTRPIANRLAIYVFFQNKAIYIYLLAAGVVTAYALYSKNLLLLFLAWIPYLGYIIQGIALAMRHDADDPRFLPTTYTFADGKVTTKNRQGSGKFGWSEFTRWQRLADSYVLFHRDGFLLAIPQADVSAGQDNALQTLLDKKISQSG